MFSRALRTSRAAPLRSNAFSKAALVKRTVTTDAASAHADKDAVPEVRFVKLRRTHCRFFNNAPDFAYTLLGRCQAIPGSLVR